MNKKALKQHLCLLRDPIIVRIYWRIIQFSPPDNTNPTLQNMISSIMSKWFLRAQLVFRWNESFLLTFCRLYLVSPPFAAVTAAHLSGLLSASFLDMASSGHNGLSWFEALFLVCDLLRFWRRVSERPCRWSRRSSWTVWSFTSRLGCLLVQWWKKLWRRGIRYVQICFDLQRTKRPVLIFVHGLCLMAANLVNNQISATLSGVTQIQDAWTWLFVHYRLHWNWVDLCWGVVPLSTSALQYFWDHFLLIFHLLM